MRILSRRFLPNVYCQYEISSFIITLLSKIQFVLDSNDSGLPTDRKLQGDAAIYRPMSDAMWYPSVLYHDGTSPTHGFSVLDSAHKPFNINLLQGVSCAKTRLTSGYALAILNAEFLLVTPGSKFTGEGGIFNEDELKNQRGSGINSIISKLRYKYPGAAQLLKTAINSSSFSDCPSPQQWSNLYNTAPGFVTPPGLDEFTKIPADYFANALRKSKIRPRIYPAPSLEEMKFEIPRIPKIWIPSTDILTKPEYKLDFNWRNFI